MFNCVCITFYTQCLDALDFLSTALVEQVEDYFHEKFTLNIHVIHIILGLCSLLQKEFHFVGIESLITGVHEENKYFCTQSFIGK